MLHLQILTLPQQVDIALQSVSLVVRILDKRHTRQVAWVERHDRDELLLFVKLSDGYAEEMESEG